MHQLRTTVHNGGADATGEQDRASQSEGGGRRGGGGGTSQRSRGSNGEGRARKGGFKGSGGAEGNI